MIKVNHVSKAFEGLKALDDVNMNVPRGSVYGLVGPNGAGKSTIIRNVTGVYRPDCGEILLDGEPVYENRSAKAKFAYIPDDFFYYNQADTMEMMRFYRGLYPNFDTEKFEQMRPLFPMIDTKKTIRSLSKGMQKQVAFWLSICTQPQLMVLDEPVDGLDPVMRRQIWSVLLSEVGERGMTVLVSSHNLRELEDVCDHVGIMNQGKIILERPLCELQSNIAKLQIACPQGTPQLPEPFEVLHISNVGRIYTLIVRGNPKEAMRVVRAAGKQPEIIDALPLTLEEIFIYELGGVNYEVKNILF